MPEQKGQTTDDAATNVCPDIAPTSQNNEAEEAAGMRAPEKADAVAAEALEQETYDAHSAIAEEVDWQLVDGQQPQQEAETDLSAVAEEGADAIGRDSSAAAHSSRERCRRGFEAVGQQRGRG